MSSLYRKWRPQRFTDLIGQDTIRDTLVYGLSHDRVSQAYLFCGPRGTGKTTTARLVAKMVNCLSDTDPKPCNHCAACTSIANGANLDVLEVDAASNRGVDEIRQLRDSVRFAPTQATYKIYIIDEAHMLTREAFNALLKTLEEPPKYALFILATTEAHKIPPTIASRCQRYDFHLAQETTLADFLSQIAAKEDITLPSETAHFLARLAEGSFRDALSLLEQVKAAGLNDYAQTTVEQLLGFVPEEQVQNCLFVILAGQTDHAHKQIDAVVARGYDLRAFCTQLLQLSQRGLEGLALGRFDGLSPVLSEQLRRVGLSSHLAWVELLAQALYDMKQSPIVRLPLDIAIAKLSIQVGSSAQTVTAQAPSVTVVKEEKPEHAKSAPVVAEVVSAVHETVAVPVAVVMPDLVSGEDWTKVLQTLKAEVPSLVTTLAHAKVSGIDGGVAKIAVRFKMHAEKINQPRNRQKIEAALGTVMQAPLKIEAHVVKDLVVEDESTDLTEIFDFEE